MALFRATTRLLKPTLEGNIASTVSFYHKNVSLCHLSSIIESNIIDSLYNCAKCVSNFLWSVLFHFCRWLIITKIQGMLDQWIKKTKMSVLVWLGHLHVVMSWNYKWVELQYYSCITYELLHHELSLIWFERNGYKSICLSFLGVIINH